MALAVSFCVPGLIPFQGFKEAGLLKSPVQQVASSHPVTLAVQSFPSDFFDLMQKPVQIQKTENTAILMQTGGFFVQNSLVSGTYQLSREFFVSTAAVRPISQKLQVQPLILAVHRVVVPIAKDYLNNSLTQSSVPIGEKAVLITSESESGFKNSISFRKRIGDKLAGRMIFSFSYQFRDFDLVFRC